MATTRRPPQNREEKRLMTRYAMGRYMGQTQEIAAAGVDIAVSTAQKWERSEWWDALILDPIRRQGLTRAVFKARRVLEDTIDLGLPEDGREPPTLNERRLAFKASTYLLDKFHEVDKRNRDKAEADVLDSLSVDELKALVRKAESQNVIDVSTAPESEEEAGEEELS